LDGSGSSFWTGTGQPNAIASFEGRAAVRSLFSWSTESQAARPIRVLLENRPLAASATQDLLDCAVILPSEFAGHDSKLANVSTPVNSQTGGSAGAIPFGLIFF